MTIVAPPSSGAGREPIGMEIRLATMSGRRVAASIRSTSSGVSAARVARTRTTVVTSARRAASRIRRPTSASATGLGCIEAEHRHVEEAADPGRAGDGRPHDLVDPDDDQTEREAEQRGDRELGREAVRVRVERDDRRGDDGGVTGRGGLLGEAVAVLGQIGDQPIHSGEPVDRDQVVGVGLRGGRQRRALAGQVGQLVVDVLQHIGQATDAYVIQLLGNGLREDGRDLLRLQRRLVGIGQVDDGRSAQPGHRDVLHDVGRLGRDVAVLEGGGNQVSAGRDRLHLTDQRGRLGLGPRRRCRGEDPGVGRVRRMLAVDEHAHGEDRQQHGDQQHGPVAAQQPRGNFVDFHLNASRQHGGR